MKNFRKVIAMVLVLALTVAMSVAGTIAYLKDTDNAKNTFTVGNIDITLNEDERKDDGKVDVFTNDKILLPIVGSAQGDTEEVTTPEGTVVNVPTAANWQDKIVTVTNNKFSQDAWVRVVFAFPADMDDAVSAAEMMLHWNHDGAETVAWKRVDNGAAVEIDDKEYNLYTYTYTEKLAPEATTKSAAITGVYIDSRVDAEAEYDDEGNMISITYSFENSRGEIKSATFTANENGVIEGPEIYVFAQGVQAAGFETAEEGLEAAFGTITATNNPWYVAP